MNDQSKIRYINPVDDKGLKALVTKAVNSYGNARVAVQVAVIAILCHAAKHHDYSQASALVNGLGGKTARDVVRFFQDFGGLSVKKPEDGEEKPEGFNAWQGPDFIAEHLDEAKATMFWLYKQPRGGAFQTYSVEEFARQFITRVENARKRAAKGEAAVKDDMSETTMQAVLNLVKFETIATKAEPEAKPSRKSAAA